MCTPPNKQTPQDNLTRCPWVVLNDPLYVAYHDQEWGVPVYDDYKHYEFLVLESAQAGLSWRTILHKRAAYRQAFANFDFEAVAHFDQATIEKLLHNPAIIRNRPKIEAAISNAKMVLKIRQKHGSLSDFLWQFVNHEPIVNKRNRLSNPPAQTPLSEKIVGALKKEGSRFIGPITMYAHLQATGIVQDHTIDCFLPPLGGFLTPKGS